MDKELSTAVLDAVNAVFAKMQRSDLKAESISRPSGDYIVAVKGAEEELSLSREIVDDYVQNGNARLEWESRLRNFALRNRPKP